METLQTHLRVYGAAYLSNYWIEARLIDPTVLRRRTSVCDCDKLMVDSGNVTFESLFLS